MSGLTFTPDPSPSLPDTTLGDPGAGPALAGGTAGFSTTPALGPIAFALGVEANAAIALFNSPDDEDPDGVLGPVPVDPPGFGALTLAPGLVLAADRAWLKYRVSALAHVAAKGAVAPVAFKVDGKAGVVFADYHVHGRGEGLRQAVTRTVAGGRLRVLAHVDDAFALRPGEALAYQVRGELTSRVTLAWSDVVATASASLARLVGPGQTLAVAVPAAATVTFDVGLVDDFRVIVTKGTAREVRVAVAKGSTRDLAIAAAARVTVKFADERAAKVVLSRLYEAVAGQAVAKVDAVLAKASLDALSPSERKVVSQLADRFGLAELASPFVAVKARWQQLKADVESTIDTVARSKVELGFAYEYRRTASNDTLLVVELSKDEYRQFHADLLVCELRPMLAWLETPAHAAALVSYLHQRSLTRSRAWGFTLGIGPWQIAGRDSKEMSAIVQETRRGGTTLVRHAYLGARAYQSAFFGNRSEWVVDFRAEQPDFVEPGSLTAADFDYGLHLRLGWQEKKLSRAELAEYLDLAVIWRVVGLRGASEIEAALTDAVKRKRRVEVAVSLTMADGAFRRLLAMVGSAPDDELGARALAKAMPFLADYDARRHPLLREACYAPLWRYYLANPSLPIDVYGAVAEREIRKMTELEDEAALARREGGLWSGTPVYQDARTFAGQIHANGLTGHGDHSGIARDWRAHVDGLRRLGRAIAAGSSPDVVKDTFKAISPFWSQWLFVRAAGVCLMDLAATDPAVFVDIERTCTVTVDGTDVRQYCTAPAGS